jgi:DNA-binding NtrC family response regulator
MRRLYQLVDRVAAGDLTVLIRGETGVGKELVAEAIHAGSARARGPLVRLNLGAVPEALLESELFGHERGAFTGATRTRPGLLESAAGGTVFLDEIAELTSRTQAKLLRVLEDRQVTRLGSVEPRPIDVRFVAATHRDLEAEVASGAFREDLYYRLAGVTLFVPPLRERVDEIEPLARAFAREAASRAHRPTPELDREALGLLERYPWPGNVRELRNAIERAIVLGAGRIDRDQLPIEKLSTPTATAFPPPPPPPVSPGEALRRDVSDLERQHIVDALARCGGNQTDAARLLGVSRRTLSTKLDRLGITRPRKR